MQKYDLLKRVFGFDRFRSLQEEAVDALIHGRDLLMILPTGGGKSLCYQLPALMREGVAVVVSPLIALMQDQVRSLEAIGIHARTIHSDMTPEAVSEVYRALRAGEVSLLYVAPERVVSEGFLSFLQTVAVSFFVIDEAHCVSEWGHEFRGDYRRLDLLKRTFPKTPVAAFTATATPRVAEDIVGALHLADPVIVRGKPIRENLTIRTQKRIDNGRRQILDFLRAHEGECGIIYAFTRKETEQIAGWLQERGFRAKAYHAGLDATLRHEVLEAFLYDRIEIVVATIAFGMGIDKSNVRFVVHTSLPKTIENFYQEIGRAGRDGVASETLLLYTKSDEILKRELLSGIEDPVYRAAMWEKLAQIYRFARSGVCKHQAIAAYFGEEIEACKDRCSSCMRPPVLQVEITEDARKLLSAIYRTGQLFGAYYIIDILRGSKAAKIKELGHDKLSVYGIGKKGSKGYWSMVVDRLFELEAIGYNAHRGLKLEPRGVGILKGEERVKVDQDKIALPESKTSPTTKRPHISAENERFEAFRRLRREIAAQERIPAYRIFSDKTLLEMAERLPQNEPQMLQISGVGAVKYERYGARFLEVARKLATERS